MKRFVIHKNSVVSYTMNFPFLQHKNSPRYLDNLTKKVPVNRTPVNGTPRYQDKTAFCPVNGE